MEEMNCHVCGKPLEPGEDFICKACEEQIRAEILGAKEGERREAQKVTKGEEYPSRVEKTPRHFRSLAEYLDYLKKISR